SPPLGTVNRVNGCAHLGRHADILAILFPAGRFRVPPFDYLAEAQMNITPISEGERHERVDAKAEREIRGSSLRLEHRATCRIWFRAVADPYCVAHRIDEVVFISPFIRHFFSE